MNAQEVMRLAPRWLVATGIAWFVLGTAVSFANEDGEGPPAIEPTVKVERDKGHGSGFYIGGAHIVTAAHVVRGETSAGVLLADGKRRRGKVVYYDSIHDLAILELLHPAPIALAAAGVSCAPAPGGSLVEVRGSPLGVDFVSAWGRVSGAPRLVKDMWRVVVPVDANVLPGHSGGPVFDDRGRVVGVAVGVHGTGNMFGSTPAGIGYFVPSKVVCDALTLLGVGVDNVANQ